MVGPYKECFKMELPRSRKTRKPQGRFTDVARKTQIETRDGVRWRQLICCGDP